ncbi:MAG: mechanosensitive ion channel family protein [Gammaproteobacteria bacterium]
MTRVHKLSHILFLCMLLPFVVFAQEEPAAEKSPTEVPEPEVIPGDKLGRDTPRGSFQGFLLAADEKNFVKAVEFMDLRYLPKRYRNAQPTRIAEMLAVVIEREFWIDFDLMSNDPDGEMGDGLPDYRDEIGRIEGETGEFVLLMQQVPDGEGGKIWKISNATVANIADLYSEFGYGPIAEAVADVVPDVDFLGLELFKWILMLALGLAVYPILLLLGLLLARIFSHPDSLLYPRVRRFFLIPFALLLVNTAMNTFVAYLGVGVRAQKMLEAQSINTILVLWVLISLSGLMRDYYAKRLTAQGKEGAIVLLRPTTQAIQILLVVIVFLVWLDNTGFDITTILAGLGVGGIAVALALQKPLEDIFGALSLYTQQPVKIGDFCRITGETGTVEEIGLRTTRIRTLDNTLISVPNARLAAEAIDNYSARHRIRYKPVLRLRIDTSAEKVEAILEKLRLMLAKHEKVDADGARVRFQAISEDALEICISAHVMETDFASYLVIAEQLNLRILEIMDSEDVSLAVPTRALLEGSPRAV